MNQNNQQEQDEHITIPAPKVADLLNVSERHVRAMNTSGRMPKPFKLGRRVLWSRREIEAWGKKRKEKGTGYFIDTCCLL